MRKYLLAAVAAAAIATPAYAQTSGPYVGIEGGLLFPRDTNIDADVDFLDGTLTDVTYNNLLEVDYKRGWDVDLIGGYDFGSFRLEGELGMKRAKIDEIQVSQEFIDELDPDEVVDADFDLDNRARVTSYMLNALGDFDLGGMRAYAGVGAGRARVKMFDDRDSAWAGQLIAGVGVPVAPNVELGAKYRYFRTGKLDFQDTFEATDADVLFRNNSRFSSHSLLASLIFSFGAPAEAPYVTPVTAAPPPPVAPATQTCPDGSVILATDVCPAPYAPPPPPPPGERG